MADPIELQIVEELRTRLAAISVAAGYHTDAGANVHLGRVIDDDHDTLPALVVWIADEVPVVDNAAPGHARGRLSVTIEGITVVTGNDPLPDAIKIARDIKRAIYVGDIVLVDGCQEFELTKVEYFPPELGSNVATGQVTLTVPYVEALQG